MALLPGSPALGAGNTTGTAATDHRSRPRVVNGKIDIGAFETQPYAALSMTVNTLATTDAANPALSPLTPQTTSASSRPSNTPTPPISPASSTSYPASAAPLTWPPPRGTPRATCQIADANNLTIDGTGASIAVNGAPTGITNGGVFYVNSTAAVTLDSLTIRGGKASGGGGIYNIGGGNLTLTNDTLSGNSAFNAGGGIINIGGGNLTLTNDTLTGNSAHEAGGIYNAGGNLTLTNDTLTGNSASAPAAASRTAAT